MRLILIGILSLTQVACCNTGRLSDTDRAIVNQQKLIDQNRTEYLIETGQQPVHRPASRVLQSNLAWPEHCGSEPEHFRTLHRITQSRIIDSMCYSSIPDPSARTKVRLREIQQIRSTLR